MFHFPLFTQRNNRKMSMIDIIGVSVTPNPGFQESSKSKLQTTNTLAIVVARYNEDAAWTKDISNVIIYNKGETLGPEYNEIMLENVGREGHTYYKHIYDNYDCLHDYIIFLQGKPQDHTDNIIEKLRDYIRVVETGNFDKNFEYLSDHIVPCNLFSGCKFHPGLPILSIYKRVFDKFISGNSVINLNFEFGAGAQFIVSKTQILKKPREFYLNIVEMLGYNVHPTEGYVIERLHKLIFS
jgi:hypothetical protein